MTLLKDQVAGKLRDRIMRGKLPPGQRVIEGKWARELGVAQASIREAINILIGEGLLTKDSGRSARVTQFSEHDVANLYQLRGVLEGLTAYLVTERMADVGSVEAELDAMAAAIRKRNMEAVLRHDMAYHLKLAELSGNPFLLESTRRILVPLFAFVLLRVLNSGQGPGAWKADLSRHQRILELIREGDPVIAEHYVRRSYGRFAFSAYAVWSNVDGAVEAHQRWPAS